MDDSNITMEEYIKLEEEKAQKRRKVFNWETAKYGRIWYDEDIHDLRSVETEFPSIAFNDEVSSEKTLSCEPTVSSLNDEIDFKISFDDSEDKDYTPEKDNDDNKIDIKQSLGDNVINTDVGVYAHESNKLLETSDDSTHDFETMTSGDDSTHDFEIMTLGDVLTYDYDRLRDFDRGTCSVLVMVVLDECMLACEHVEGFEAKSG
ncbi:hypothetical protein Tco_0071333 [Tanacetum coccineum]